MAGLKGLRGHLLAMPFVWSYFSTWLGWIYVLAQVNPDCDFTYYLQFGQQQILQSPGFDQGMYYDPGKVCRWAYSSPAGTVFDVSCNPIDMPASRDCEQDRLVISITGSPTLSDGQNYCGYGNAHATSSSNALTIGLISASYSNGGRYRCVITPIAAGGTTPTTTTTTPRPNTCDCGWRQQRRIIGGVETRVNEFAFMAALIDIDKQAIWCGATIISDRYAVTAAHCVIQQTLTQFGLLVGDHNIKQPSETTAAALYQLEDYITHEYYSGTTQQNDIAIVRTSRPITFSLEVGPVCLPYRYTDLDFTGAPVTALGWGFTAFLGQTSDALRKVNLTVVSKAACQQGNPKETIYNSQICTYGEGKDSCTFDSGGPVIWFDDFNTNRYQLVGIISYGRDCGTSSPGVNTRVPSYVSWILNQIPDGSVCFK